MQKILIIGNGGAGKSTFADKLSKHLDLPIIHLDTLHWKSENKVLSPEEFDKILLTKLQKKSWIIDGNYQRTLGLRTRYADTIIFLDYPKSLALSRAIKRYLQQKIGIYHLKSGNPAVLRWKFIQWILTFPREKMLASIEKNHNENTKLILLKSPQETETFLKCARQDSNLRPTA